MKTITLEGFVHCRPEDQYELGHVISGMAYKFWPVDNMKASGYALVAAGTLTVQVSDSFNPNPQFVAALEEQEKKITVEFQKRVTEIRRQMSQYTAITMEAA